ncbi:MAG: indolepyruvate ferredoxin oxidoreductase subunit alpha [Bacteroidales bacterium]|nr:indolepyruvate ferredoxin oxidoreductase subunit alpha [Bacteroidales bacterium]
MKEKRLLLGDEAIALGAIYSGLSGVYAYPGTPSTEITEFIQNDPLAKERGIRSRWCTNEKTAMEAALGMSYAGKRAMVCMKHVGMNVCADAFVNSAITGVNGGIVVIAADDPSMHSSQNEQDSRFYGKFAMIPIIEPSNQQECFDCMAHAFELSEKLRLPVLLRMVTRLAHSRAAVNIGVPCQQNCLKPDDERGRWVLLPGNARKQYDSLISKQPEIESCAQESPYNRLELGKEGGTGVIASGIGYNYVKEASPEGISILKLSQYPIPKEEVKKLSSHCSDIVVVEDGQPFIEEQLKAILAADYPISGRLTGRLPRTGELNPDNVAAAFGKTSSAVYQKAVNISPRPPQLCQGCGHRDVYTALNKVLEEYPTARVFGDIGCYTLGALPPFRAIDSCVDMGASITMAKGAADAGLYPAIAVIGDSTFTHSGMTSLLDAVNDNSPITVILSDNLTTAMTGGQDSAGTHKFEAICLALGVEREHLHVVVPLPKNMDSITETIRREIDYKGVSVIIPQRECMQTLSRKMRAKKNSTK